MSKINDAEIINYTLSSIKKSLSNISEIYFGLNYWKETDGLLEYHEEEFREYLRRHHERVFCYELYYHIRGFMDKVPKYYENIFLQGEIIKDKLPPKVLEYFQVSNLEKEYMPDFILHTPGNFKNQLIVIEVKSNPKITFTTIFNDLAKIAEFIETFNYKKGIFLAVNTTPSHIAKMLKQNSLSISKIPEQTRLKILVMIQSINPKQYAQFSLQDLFISRIPKANDMEK